jgi:hypothetical protein
MVGFKEQDWTRKRPNRHKPALNPNLHRMQELMSVFAALKRSFRIAVNEVVIRSATEMEHIHSGGFVRSTLSCLF